MTPSVKVTSVLTVLAALSGMAFSARAQMETYRVVTWASLSDRDLSPLVQQVYDAEGKRWRNGESDRVLAHAATLEELGAMMEEAQYAWQAVGSRLGLPNPTNRARLVYVYESSTWDGLGRRSGIRPDGLALQSGRDILLKVDASQSERRDRIAHEIVHFRLREAYGDRLPLWLEEGLATVMGIDVTRDYNNTQGTRLAGAWPAVPSEALLSPGDLLGRSEYPPSPGAAQAYGRQAAELVILLRERIGPDRWSMALREIGQRGDWRSTLASGYGLPMVEVEQMAGVAARRSTRPWSL